MDLLGFDGGYLLLQVQSSPALMFTTAHFVSYMVIAWFHLSFVDEHCYHVALSFLNCLDFSTLSFIGDPAVPQCSDCCCLPVCGLKNDDFNFEMVQ